MLIHSSVKLCIVLQECIIGCALLDLYIPHNRNFRHLLSLDLRGYAPSVSIVTQSKVSCMSHKQSIDNCILLLAAWTLVLHNIHVVAHYT